MIVIFTYNLFYLLYSYVIYIHNLIYLISSRAFMVETHSWIMNSCLFFCTTIQQDCFLYRVSHAKEERFQILTFKRVSLKETPKFTFIHIYLVFTAEYLIQPFNSLRSSLTLYSDMSVYIQTKINIVLNDQVLLGD